MRHIGRIVLGAAAVVLVGGGVAMVPASASGTTFSWSAPASDGAVLQSGPITLSGQVSQAGGGSVDQVSVSVDWTDSRGQGPQPYDTNFTSGSRVSTYPWSVNPPTQYNGRYSVAVTALTDNGPGTSRTQSNASRSFVVDVPPASPTGVGDKVDANAKSFYVYWNSNPEPDLIGYEILRAGPNSSDPYKAIYGVAAGTNYYTDTEVAKEPAGTWRYEVAAVRPSGPSASKSDVSAPTAAPDTLTFGAPPPPPPPSQTGSGSGTSSSGSATGSHTGGTNAGSPAAAPAATTNQPSSGRSFAPSSPGLSPIVLPVTGSGLGAYNDLNSRVQRATQPPPEADTGYNAALPYQAPNAQKPISLPGDLAAGPLGSNHGSSRTAEYVAGALLLAVLAGFALVLRKAADQSALLEPVPAEEPEPEPAADGSLLLTIYSAPPVEDPEEHDEEPVLAGVA